MSTFEKTQVPPRDLRLRRLRAWWGSNWAWVIAIAIGATVVLAVYGAHQYLRETGQPARLTDSLYMALQCFNLDDSPKGGTVGYPIAFQIARFVAPLALIGGIAYTLIRLFRGQLDRWLARRLHGHMIICGLGELGQALAKTAIDPRKIAVIEQRIDPHAEEIKRIRQLGVKVLIGDARDVEDLTCAGIREADRVVVVCGSDVANGEVLHAIDKAVGQRRRKLTVQVQIMDIELAEQLQLNEIRFGPRVDSCLAVDYTCLPLVAAEHLLTAFPPADSPVWPQVVIAGAGLMAEALLIGLAQLRLRKNFEGWPRVVLVDDDAKDMLERVHLRHPRIRALLDVHCDKPHTCADYVTEGSEVVYICLDNETSAVALGLTLQLLATKPKRTVVQTWHEKSLLEVTAGQKTGGAVVEHGSVLEAISEFLLGGPQEQWAKAIHELYVSSEREKIKANDPSAQTEDSPSLKKWAELSPDMKDQNRNQASHYEKLLEHIGARIVASLSIVDDDPFFFAEDQIEILAEAEHNRWWKTQKAAGWECSDLGSKKDPVAKTHPCLRPFQDLPPDEQDKDRSMVRNIPKELAACNYAIVPMQGRGERGQEVAVD